MRLLFLFLTLLPLFAMGQGCTMEQYQKLLKDADAASQRGQYDMAINKLQSAKTCRPEKEAEVNTAVIKVFKKVNSERERAIANELKARKQEKIALEKTEEAKQQRDSAVMAQRVAEKGRRTAENLAIGSATSDFTFALQTFDYNRKRHPTSRASMLSYFKLINDPVNGFYNKVYQGHSTGIQTLDISPDGKMAVSGALGEPAIVWDLEQNKILCKLSATKFGFWAAVFSNSGKWILSANGTVAKLWDAHTGQLLKTFGTASITSMGYAFVGFSPEDDVLTVGNDEQAILWDPITAEKKATYGISMQANVFMAGILDKDPEPTQIANHQEEDFLTAFVKGKFIHNIDGYRISTSLFDYNHRGLLFADNYFLDIHGSGQEKGVLQQLFPNHKDLCSAVRFLGDDQLVTGSYDGTVKIWDIKSGKMLRSFAGHKGKVTSIAVHLSGYGRFLLTGGEDKLIKRWDLNSMEPIVKLAPQESSILDVNISPDGNLLLQACGNQIARLLETKTGKAIYRLEGHQDDVRLVRFSPDGSLILTASRDKTAKIWETASGKLLATFSDHLKPVTIAAFSPDGKYVMTGSSDEYLYFWDPATGKLIRKIFSKADDIEYASISPDGKSLLIVYDHAKPRRLNSSTDALILEYNMKSASFGAFSPDGSIVYLSTYQNDGLFGAFNAKTGELIYSIQKKVTKIAFSPDGKLMYMNGLYDAQSGVLIRDFSVLGIGDKDVFAFFPDGNKIAIDEDIWCVGMDCLPEMAYIFSPKELRALGVQLELEDLLVLWEQGVTLTKDELNYIGKDKNNIK